MRRRLFILSGGAAAALAVSARPAQALLGVACPDCSTIYEQLLSYKTQLDQWTTQLTQAMTELNSYKQLLLSGLSLPTMVWGMAQGDIAMIRGIANGASLLSGNAGGLMTRLSTLGSYANILSMTPTMLSAQFQTYQSVFSNADQQLGRVLQTASADGTRIALTQEGVKAQAASAAGQLQAIQAGVSMSSLISDQMQTMQTTMQGLAQEIGTRDLIDADRTAQQDQAWTQFLGGAQLPTTGGEALRFQGGS